MSLILGMDPWVFVAWILTIISAIFCIIYGLYYEFLKRFSKSNKSDKKKKMQMDSEVK
jgi:heme/copper-type cytochrome/quinol oxidase subunit 2